MGCSSCGTKVGGGCSPAGCKSNGTCGTSGCNSLNTLDWFSDIDMPTGYETYGIVEVRFGGRIPGRGRWRAAQSPEFGGSRYNTADMTPDAPFEFWLCPALFAYFDRAPKDLYVQYVSSEAT